MQRRNDNLSFAVIMWEIECESEFDVGMWELGNWEVGSLSNFTGSKEGGRCVEK